MQRMVVGVVVLALVSGCATRRQGAISVGVLGAGVVASGTYLVASTWGHCTTSDPTANEDPSCSDGGAILTDFLKVGGGFGLIGAGVAGIGAMIYLLVAKDEAWLDAEPESP